MENLTLFGEPIQEKKTRLEKFNDYDGFVDKFKPKKTTDDCYTPPKVYEVVRQWVNDNIVPLDGVEIVRPFYPGGDYRSFDYPDGCIVLDNPPFSILAGIRKFYQERGIRYFLFAPLLTCAGSSTTDKETCIVTSTRIVYENGASIPTMFVTNILDSCAIILSPTLTNAINDAQEQPKPKQSMAYPDNVVSPPLLEKYVKRLVCNAQDDVRIGMESCRYVKKIGTHTIFGGGWLISNRTRDVLLGIRDSGLNKDIVSYALSAEEQRIIENLK